MNASTSLLSRADLPLVPWDVPWFAHTTFWAQFSAEEKLTANRLMGLVINELFLLFEHGFIVRGLEPVFRLIQDQKSLSRQLESLITDEQRHVLWFSHYNKSCAPAWYQRADGLRMLSPTPLQSHVALTARAMPGSWVFSLWLAFASENWSCNFSRIMASDLAADCDPAYRALHANHLRDEQRHVHIDQTLLFHLRSQIWPPFLPIIAHLVLLMHTSIMRPRRAVKQMVKLFATQHPRWQPRTGELCQAIRHLGSEHGYWSSAGVANNGDLLIAHLTEWVHAEMPRAAST